jgi:hypothetical protein
MIKNSAFWTPALAVLAVAACATSPTGRRQLSLVSEDSAIVASKEAYVMQMAELKRAGKVVDDGRVTRRVDQIRSPSAWSPRRSSCGPTRPIGNGASR